MSMDLAVMEPTDRHGELVADLAPKRTGLGKSEMMRIGGCAATDDAGLAGHELAVILVA